MISPLHHHVSMEMNLQPKQVYPYAHDEYQQNTEREKGFKRYRFCVMDCIISMHVEVYVAVVWSVL